MKKTMKEIRMLGLLTMAAAALLACSRLESPTPQTYTVTVEGARKGGVDPATKGTLTDESTTISTAWSTNDKVYINTASTGQFKNAYLQPQTAGATATLSGTLDGTGASSLTLTVGQDVWLQNASRAPLANLTPSLFSNQKGTLAYIGDNLDICYQKGKIATIEDGNISITLDGKFNYRYAIVKFTLMNDSSLVNAERLKVTIGDPSVESNTLTTDVLTDCYSTNGNGVVYLAVPAMTEAKDITLKSQYYDGGEGKSNDYVDQYTCTANKQFEAGKFYRVTAYLQ